MGSSSDNSTFTNQESPSSHEQGTEHFEKLRTSQGQWEIVNFICHTDLEGMDQFNTTKHSQFCQILGGLPAFSLAGAAAFPELPHGNSIAFVL